MKIKELIISILSLIIKVAVIVVAISFISKGAVKAFSYGYSVFEDKPFEVAPGRDISVTIPLGSGSKRIGEILQESGVIADAKLFYIQNLLSNYKDDLKAGTYVLNTSMSAEQIMMELAGVDEESSEEGEEN